MISVVCVFNDRKILDECLLKSLEDQEVEYELILVDNTQNRYKSAAEALNYGGGKAQGEYIMFAHQDVDLCSSSFVRELEECLDSLPDLGLAGVAGMPFDQADVITNMLHGDPPKNVSPYNLNRPTRVQTVDECLFVIPSARFRQLSFDPEVTPGWHLYAVDYSLSIITQGFAVYVLPFTIYHKSIGYSISREYYQTVVQLLEKHGDHHQQIHTTMGHWDARKPMITQKIKQQLDWNISKLKEFLNRE